MTWFEDFKIFLLTKTESLPNTKNRKKRADRKIKKLIVKIYFKCSPTSLYFGHCKYVSKHFRCLKLLLSHGADINPKNKCDMTALHFSCQLHQEEIISSSRSSLLLNGAQFSPKNSSGKTPLLLLNSEKTNFSNCLEVMAKKYAKICETDYIDPEIDKNYFQSNQFAQNLYRKYSTEVSKMKAIVFYKPYSSYTEKNP